MLTEAKNRNPSAVSAQTTAFMLEKNLISFQKPRSARKIEQVKTVEIKLGENLIKRTLSPTPFNKKIKGDWVNSLSGAPLPFSLNAPPPLKNRAKFLKNSSNGLSYRGAPKTFFEMKKQMNLKEKNLKLSARKEEVGRRKEEEGSREEEGGRREKEGGRREEGEIREEEEERRRGEFGVTTVWRDGFEGEEFLFRTK